jgi:hypothetical protein
VTIPAIKVFSDQMKSGKAWERVTVEQGESEGIVQTDARLQCTTLYPPMVVLWSKHVCDGLPFASEHDDNGNDGDDRYHYKCAKKD